MNYKRVGIALAALVMAGIGYFFLIDQREQRITGNDVFVVGIAAGYAPYISINERGEYEGFDIDVIRSVAERLNKKLVLKDLGSMTSLMMALDQGTIDAIIWGVSITQERLQKYTMIHYQGALTDSYPLIFWNTIPSNIRTLNDMAGLTVCVEPSSAQSVILERYKTINILPVEKVDDALLNLQYGKADAALLDPVIANKFKKRFSEIKIVSIPLEPQDQTKGIGIVLKQKSSVLAVEIQRAIDLLSNDGTLAQFESKWGIL